MGYFQVRYDSRVVNYDRRGFIRLATGLTSSDSVLRRNNIILSCSGINPIKFKLEIAIQWFLPLQSSLHTLSVDGLQDIQHEWCAAEWPDGLIAIWYLAIYNNENSPNSIKTLAKVGSKFWQILNKPSTFCQSPVMDCQSDEILPNLVTLGVCVNERQIVDRVWTRGRKH